jgi:hypothetical protein
MKCKHETPRGLTWDEEQGWMTGGDDARICRWCSDWLSLGHSDETDPRVAVEIRAAEIAQAVIANGYYPTWPGRTQDEMLGWSIAETNMQHHGSDWLAGLLARVIATHGGDGE